MFPIGTHELENKYGPLTNFGYAPSRCPWQWADQPWPWDREFNY
ncbi:spore coat protein CotJB [Clostridioides difficile]